MNREQEILDEIRKVLAGFGPKLAGFKVLLFGSRANNSAKERSDFDLAIIGPTALDSRLYHDILESLDNIDTLYGFDLVDLACASLKLRAEVLKNNKVLYEGYDSAKIVQSGLGRI
ncbi:MAG: nucleotidyltransferase domain-containing protein [Deltaproteobacteria bacterium]|nr:nucleotidyltransferase domain-containing protein [Deltaproteobacteria bacterium]